MMAPKGTLSARDIEVVAAAFQCLKTPPDIDYDKLAEKAGYKNGQSARACFQDIKKKLRASAGDDAIPTTTKKPSTATTKKRKQLHSPSSSSATLASSSPTITSDNDEPTTKKPKTTKAKTTRAKKPVISTPEQTEEDINNAKAIAAGRARYAADTLAAQIKEEDDESPVVDRDAEAEDADQEPMGMNIDSGEDEGLTAYELVKNEVFGEGVEI